MLLQGFGTHDDEPDEVEGEKWLSFAAALGHPSPEVQQYRRQKKGSGKRKGKVKRLRPGLDLA